MSAATRSILTPESARVLGRTRAVHLLALVDDEEIGQRVMSRADLVAWLDASDLPDLAREARTRKVEPGHLLVLMNGGAAGARLVVVRADASARRARR